MTKDARLFVKACLACRSRKSCPPKAAAGEMRSIVVEHPFSVVQMDVFGPLVSAADTGNRYVVTFFDCFTRWPEAVTFCEPPTAHDVADALFEAIITRHACPRAILTDRGSNFMKDVFERLLVRMQIKHLKTSSYHPRTNGRVEGLHYFLATAIYAFVDARHRELGSLSFVCIICISYSPYSRDWIQPV